MAKLGTQGHPAIVRVQTEERAQEILERCGAHGIQVIIGLEPDKPEDISDVERAISPPEPARVASKVGRNDPCPCGSGQKSKRCHGAAQA